MPEFAERQFCSKSVTGSPDTPSSGREQIAGPECAAELPIEETQMDRVKNILVAIDFSPCSAAAFRQAARMAVWNGAAVNVIHVVSIPGFTPGMDSSGPISMPAERTLIANAQRQWDGFALDCPARAGAQLSIEVGNPREVILEHVRRDRPDLLIVGAHSTLDAGRAIGSTAGALVQRAASRVVVVREAQSGPFNSIVACVDFSDGSMAALEQAVRIGAQDGAAVQVLTVYDDPWCGVAIPMQIQTNMPDFPVRYARAVEDRLRAFCEPLAHELGALKAGYHVRKAQNHGEGIIAFIQSAGCDLAVLGTRGRANLRDFFWGSTAERVVRDCPCSVLAVKPPGFVQLESYQPFAQAEVAQATGRGLAAAGARAMRL